MISLSSFSEPINAAVIGSSGGIGTALVKELKASQKVENIFPLSRSGKNGISIDICDEASIKNAVSNIDVPLHLIIVATGLLHNENIMPEKSIRDLNAEKMRKLYDTNTIGPALIAKHFIPLTPRNGKSVFVAISARVGSISDKQLGGWHSYRASKAALNMIIKNTAIETARKHKESAVIGLHPGTVNTNLSSPFQSNVKEGKLFTPDQSAKYLLEVINKIDHTDTGKIFAWDGKEIQP